jgi:hypothetical protein
MKNKVIYTIIISMTVMACTTRQQSKESTDIPKEWKFHTGDNPEYSKSGFDDHSWKVIQTGNPVMLILTELHGIVPAL